ncbi:MAG: divergent polysaccharide deacetylase family protein [Candidatus Omnitrophica bacterium]|nr:divergent polysaccharide deacetylase family protein [Candidatus Omnitrophota bacterium]MDD5690648.1 divergent polysaccharide deacetylase family protein [Candidatus Omnitrophota bacterium]
MKKKLIITIALILSLFVFIAVILTSVDRRLTRKAVPAKGRIAIVIDDWGYNLNNLEIAKEIKQPLTCAILPNLNNSRLLAQELHNLGFEIILHLPMEPKEKYRLERNTIRVSMDDGEIRNILDRDLASILFVKGISNHMGSRITEDARVSALIMSEAKKRKLYFLDSFVTAKSACPLLARKIKVRFAKRDIFLDNLDDPSYIKGQIIKLRDLAKKNGQAIGIGHDRKNTLVALKETIPQLIKAGYKLVFVSEVAK